MKEWTWDITIEDRIALKSLLLQCRGTYAQQLLSDKLISEILSDEEQKRLDIHADAQAGMIVFRTADEKGKPINTSKKVKFGPEGRDLITRNLAMMDEAGMLERMYRHIYELFILTPWPEPE